MAGDTHDISEVWGKVENLEKNVANIAETFERGLSNLATQISRSNERIDQRISDTQLRTDTRFEAIQQQNLAQLSSKSSVQWQIFAFVGSTVLALAGTGATFWALAKAPIDNKFADIDKSIYEVSAAIKEQGREFVPVNEIRIIENKQDRNTDVLQDMAKTVATIQANQANSKDRLDQLREDEKSFATVPQYQQLDNRVTVISQRLQTVFDKNFAVPVNPCIGSGCAGQSAPTPPGK